jgi:hypothetical protein
VPWLCSNVVRAHITTRLTSASCVGRVPWLCSNVVLLVEWLCWIISVFSMDWLLIFYTAYKHLQHKRRTHCKSSFNTPILTPYTRAQEDYRVWGECQWFQNIRLPYYHMLHDGRYEAIKSLFEFYYGMLPVSEVKSPVSRSVVFAPCVRVHTHVHPHVRTYPPPPSHTYIHTRAHTHTPHTTHTHTQKTHTHTHTHTCTHTRHRLEHVRGTT